MPISCKCQFTPLTQAEFGKLSYDVIAEVLAIRRKLGRFFDEKHYKRALSLRRSDVILEVPILVSHRGFEKYYFLDVLVAMGGVFEFKAAETLVSRHKAQLLHYLMIAELWHGMLVNIRTEKLEREFVNNAFTHQDRLMFDISTENWQSELPGAERFESLLVALLNDWGTCLDLGLYQEAITYFCGGDATVIRPANVILDGHELGPQNLRFIVERTAFKLTAFESSESQSQFASHAQRLVNHSDIDGVLWANIGRHQVTLHTITSKC